jgi:hypothetical protein
MTYRLDFENGKTHIKGLTFNDVSDIFAHVDSLISCVPSDHDGKWNIITKDVLVGVEGSPPFIHLKKGILVDDNFFNCVCKKEFNTRSFCESLSDYNIRNFLSAECNYINDFDNKDIPFSIVISYAKNNKYQSSTVVNYEISFFDSFNLSDDFNEKLHSLVASSLKRKKQ